MQVGCVSGRGNAGSGCDWRRSGWGYDLCACRDACRQCKYGKMLTLVGDGADVVTVEAADASDYVYMRSWGDDMYRKTAVTFLE